MRLHLEKKSDRVTVDHEKKTDKVRVHHERESDGVRVTIRKSEGRRVHNDKERWGETSP